MKKSETVKMGLFEPFISIFNYQWPFILFKNLINHSNNGPKNKLRVESIKKYQLKNHIGLKECEGWLNFSRIEIKCKVLYYSFLEPYRLFLYFDQIKT